MRLILDTDPAIRDLIWDDTKIPVDGDWRKEIMDHVARACIMIMLGSPDYFAPDCGAAELEIKPALDAYQKGEMSILWFRVRDHSISTAPVCDIMAATGPGAVPLETLPPDEQDAALCKIHQQVLSILGQATGLTINHSYPGKQREPRKNEHNTHLPDGNAGSPSRPWYRQRVALLLVPRNRSPG